VQTPETEQNIAFNSKFGAPTFGHITQSGSSPTTAPGQVASQSQQSTSQPSDLASITFTPASTSKNVSNAISALTQNIKVYSIAAKFAVIYTFKRPITV
jgi:hypothetical protein